jgi:hypothetical protein
MAISPYFYVLQKLNIKLPFLAFGDLQVRVDLIPSLQSSLSFDVLELIENFLQKGASADYEDSIDIPSFHKLADKVEILFFVLKISLHVTQLFLTYVHQRDGVECISVRHHLLHV